MASPQPRRWWLLCVVGVESLAPGGVARRAFVVTAGGGVASVARASRAAAPWNPLGLKGQFWETGSMVYKKGEVVPVEGVEALIDEVRLARRYAEVGDLDAARRTLEAVSERDLRLGAAARVEDDDLVARAAFAQAMAAYDRVTGALASRETSPFVSSALAALATSGLVFLVPPSLLKPVLQRTSDETLVSDAGLAVVAALDDCLRHFDDFLAALPTPPPPPPPAPGGL